jgi:hypothetical protein
VHRRRDRRGEIEAQVHLMVHFLSLVKVRALIGEAGSVLISCLNAPHQRNSGAVRAANDVIVSLLRARVFHRD